MTLEELGWSPTREEAFAEHAARGRFPARVTVPHRGMCWALCAAGEVEAGVAGKLRRRGELPAAGDWVAVAPATGAGRALIDAVLPRATRFSRKTPGRARTEQVVAANIDTVFVVTAVRRDLNLRRIERYLALAWESGAVPVVVISKLDVDEHPEQTIAEVAAVAPGVAVLPVSGRTGEGVEALRGYLGPGRTVALVGSSGVGKSTLINALLGERRQRVDEVGAWGKGRHTTSERELIPVPGGGLVLDTPGLREIQLFDAASGIDETFTDLDALAASCRFRDCRHDGEPDCAVREAIGRGEVPQARVDAQNKLLDEQRFRETQLDRQAQSEIKRSQREIQRALRAHLDAKYGRKE